LKNTSCRTTCKDDLFMTKNPKPYICVSTHICMQIYRIRIEQKPEIHGEWRRMELVVINNKCRGSLVLFLNMCCFKLFI
jgi:hypothetical protein